MEYLKVYVDFAESLELLQDAEIGRLFKAMLCYAKSGEQPDLKGNERFIWPNARQIIDREAASLAYHRENGGKGGRPKTKQNQEKPNETKQNQEKPNESKENPYKEKEKEKKRKDKENTATVVAVENARATAADDGMPFGLSEADVDASLALDQRIEDACKQWGLPCSPGNLMQGRDMVREYGEEWLMQAMRIAGENHPTWGYVKGVLQKAKQNGTMELPKASKPGKTVSAQQYGQRDYTEDELMAVSGDLIAEARAKYESGVTA